MIRVYTYCKFLFISSKLSLLSTTSMLGELCSLQCFIVSKPSPCSLVVESNQRITGEIFDSPWCKTCIQLKRLVIHIEEVVVEWWIIYWLQLGGELTMILILDKKMESWNVSKIVCFGPTINLELIEIWKTSHPLLINLLSRDFDNPIHKCLQKPGTEDSLYWISGLAISLRLRCKLYYKSVWWNIFYSSLNIIG